MNEHARIAIRAAKHRHVWGRWATFKYVEKRGVPTRLYVLARILEVTKGIEI